MFVVLGVAFKPHSCSSYLMYRTDEFFFTARCTMVQSVVLRLHVVCLSVCLSVTLVDQDHAGWKSWKLIARTIRAQQDVPVLTTSVKIVDTARDLGVVIEWANDV